MGRFRLVARQGQDAGCVFHLRGKNLTLGRPGAEGDSTVEFQEPSVSRVHALLKWRDDQGCYELSNRSFTSPTQINGKPAPSGALLLHGTTIKMGALMVEVRDSREDLPDPEPFMGCLELLGGPGLRGTRYPLHRTRVTLGRSQDCNIHLPTPALSPIHASIEWYERLPVLLPLSQKEIYVNGQAIPRGTFLRPGDFILLGTGVALRWVPVSLLAKEERSVPAPCRQETPNLEPEPADEPAGALPAEIPESPPERVEKNRAAGTSQRATFFANLARRLECGEPICRAIEESASSFMPALAGRLEEAFDSGQGLAETLARFSGYFTPYELGMVAAGEEAGLLDELLVALADSLEAEHLTRTRQDRAVLLASLLVAVSLTALCLFPLFRQPGPAAFGTALAVSLGGTALLGFVLHKARWMLQRRAWFGRWADRLKNRLPLVGPTLRLQAGERFLKALGLLLGSGLPAHRGALLAAGCTGSTAHTIALMLAASRIEKGEPILDSLATTGLFKPQILAEVEKGEEQGDLPERLAAASDRLKEASRTATARSFPLLASGQILLIAGLSVLSAVLVLLACL